MSKSTWRDRFEFALQTAIERSSGVRELASRGLEEGARQLGAWQERQRQGELLLELGRATWRLAQAGRLHDIDADPAVAEVLARLAQDEGTQANRKAGDGFADEGDLGSFFRSATGNRQDLEDDGTVSSLAGRSGSVDRAAPRAPWTADADLDAADLAAFMHPDDLESR